MDVLEILQKSGLDIDQVKEGPCLDGYTIKIKQIDQKSKIIARQSLDGDRSRTIGDITCLICFEQGSWIFSVWESIPGPFEGEFAASFHSLQDALAAVFDFYFGKPTVIDGWKIPFHRHPELDKTTAQQAISHAIPVSEHEFQRILAENDAERSNIDVEQLSSWERALKSQFLTIRHTTDHTISLRLRRDLQEAYILHEGSRQNSAS